MKVAQAAGPPSNPEGTFPWARGCRVGLGVLTAQEGQWTLPEIHHGASGCGKLILCEHSDSGQAPPSQERVSSVWQLLGPLRTWTPWKQMNTSVVLRGSGTSPGQAATGLCKGSPAAHAALPRSISGHFLHQTNSCLAPLCPPRRSPHKGWCAGSPHRGKWWRNSSQGRAGSGISAWCLAPTQLGRQVPLPRLTPLTFQPQNKRL